MAISKLRWAQGVVAVFDYSGSLWSLDDGQDMGQLRSNLTNVERRKEMPREESLWLLHALSELRSEWWRLEKEPFLIGICLAILSNHAPEWDDDIVLLEAVVTLAAMSCSLERANRPQIFTKSREHPWLCLNVRNPALFANSFEDVPPDYHKQLISLLFLVVYAFFVGVHIP